MTNIQQIIADNPSVAKLGTKWLAENVGKVSLRTWQFWVHGRNGKTQNLPDDVIEAMNITIKFLQDLENIKRPQRKPGPRCSYA